jgi:hypothetical protein
MKKLVSVVLLQTVVLLLLLWKIVVLEDEITSAMPGEQESFVTSNLRDVQAPSTPDDTRLYPNEDRLRQIIREELHTELDREFQPGMQSELDSEPDSGDRAELEYRRELVAQQLEHYASVGSISDADMQKLQIDIAKLDDAGRMEMLRELSRAFNSGRLEGRL